MAETALIYVAGAALAWWVQRWLGFMPGISATRQRAMRIITVVLWPISLVVLLLAAIDNIGVSRR